MAATATCVRRTLAFNSLRLIARTSPSSTIRRTLSTLPSNPSIYVHEQDDVRHYLYSCLSTNPPLPSLAVGSSPRHPPTPDSFVENQEFLRVLQGVIKDHAVHDPAVQAQAAMYASQAGSSLGSGGAFFAGQKQKRRSVGGGGGAGGDGAGGASAQGGMGGAGRGGFVHVSDQRNPPDFGRVAWPEDIFGSLELDGEGKFVDGTGRYQESGTYRVVTNEGFLGLSDYLREKLVERLKELDAQAR